jgi:hypothetical protein
MRKCIVTLCALLLIGCATPKPAKDYTALRAEDPHSILVVPVLNNTTSVTAPDYFLSTISRPFAERGYYVFPAFMVRRLLEENGLADAGLVHNADPTRLAGLFGCNSVLLISINRWDSQYVIIRTDTTVEFAYTLKSCKTGAVLWENTQAMTYSPQAANSSGNPIADLVAQAIISALEKADPNYMPLAQQANLLAATAAGQGLPAGPYLPNYKADLDVFPGH